MEGRDWICPGLTSGICCGVTGESGDNPLTFEIKTRLKLIDGKAVKAVLITVDSD